MYDLADIWLVGDQGWGLVVAGTASKLPKDALSRRIHLASDFASAKSDARHQVGTSVVVVGTRCL